MHKILEVKIKEVLIMIILELEKDIGRWNMEYRIV